MPHLCESARRDMALPGRFPLFTPTPREPGCSSDHAMECGDVSEDLGMIWAGVSGGERQSYFDAQAEQVQALDDEETTVFVTNAPRRRYTLAFKKIWLKFKFHVRSAHDCVACREHIPGIRIRAPCGHYYDKDCITSLFEASIRDESLFHPSCCQKPIPFRTVRKHFSPTLRAMFIEKSREYRTRKRVYCSMPPCGRFLGPQVERKHFRIRKIYKCKCGAATCPRCKNARHDHMKHTCSDNTDAGAGDVLVLGEQEGWARCPGCRTMIELNMGCYHITCVCKVQFCYLCQARWKTCQCPQWEVEVTLAEEAQPPAPALAPWNQPPHITIHLNREQCNEHGSGENQVHHACQPPEKEDGIVVLWVVGVILWLVLLVCTSD